MAPREVPFLAAVEFGRRVRSARTDRGWSLEVLADHAGLHWTYVGSVERGRRNIALRNILKLAEALDLNPAILVDGLRPG